MAVKVAEKVAASRGGGGSGEPPASTPVGSQRAPMNVGAEGEPPINDPANINGRDYSGHAVDRMQGRGIPPSAVENTINTGHTSPGNTPGTTAHYDPVNNITVVTNSQGGVVTVRYGRP